MLTGLLFTAFLMGLGGMPHCAAMCGAACAVAFPRGLPVSSWLGRLLGYATLGAVAAVSAGAVSRWGRDVAMLKPLWIMAQVAVVLLGIRLLISGRMPALLDGAGRAAYDGFRARMADRGWALSSPWRSLWQAGWPLVGGMAWALLPCGLLYAALMLAALAPHAWGGALVMLAFGVPSSVGVWAAPWVMRRLGLGRSPAAADAAVPVIWLRPKAGDAQQALPAASPTSALRGAQCAAPASAPASTAAWVDPRWAVRASGLGLSLMGVWSVWHQLVAQWQAWCA